MNIKKGSGKWETCFIIIFRHFRKILISCKKYKKNLVELEFAEIYEA